MNRADLVGGAGLTAAGLLLIFVIIPLGTEEGMYFGLAPTFFPTLLASCLTLAATALTLQAWLRLKKERGRRPGPIERWNVMMFGLAAALALGGVMMIDVFGMLIGGPVLIAAFMLFLGERHPVRILVTSVLPVLVVYVLALHVLGAPVP
ncbi:MAG: tripartite tricarboxylate transporter TctB family protein [Alphaproteobacteria bacterium]